MGFVVEKTDLGQVFHRFLWFSPTNDHFSSVSLSHLSSGAGKIGPFLAAVPREVVSHHLDNSIQFNSIQFVFVYMHRDQLQS
jgi:hypothetical protein